MHGDNTGGTDPEPKKHRPILGVGLRHWVYASVIFLGALAAVVAITLDIYDRANKNPEPRPDPTSPAVGPTAGENRGNQHGVPGNEIANKIDEPHRRIGERSITTGQTADYVQSILGLPALKNSCGEESEFEAWVYSYMDRYVQLIFNSERSLTAYSVTSLALEARVVIPAMDVELGTRSFKALLPALFFTEDEMSYISSKGGAYVESTDLGNIGNFRTFFLASLSEGFEYTPDGTYFAFYEISESNRLRENYPNSFGVSDALSYSFVECGFGVDPIRARSLPAGDHVVFDTRSFW